MVVDAVGEPYLFEVFLKSLELWVVAVALISCVYFFEHVAQLEIQAAVLVPQDVASGEGGLCEMVYEHFLAQRQFVEIGHWVA